MVTSGIYRVEPKNSKFPDPWDFNSPKNLFSLKIKYRTKEYILLLSDEGQFQFYHTNSKKLSELKCTKEATENEKKKVINSLKALNIQNAIKIII